MRWYRIPRGYTTTAHGYTLVVEKMRGRPRWWWEVKNTAGPLNFGRVDFFKDAKATAIAAAAKEKAAYR